MLFEQNNCVCQGSTSEVHYICSLGTYDLVWFLDILYVQNHICILRSWNVAYALMIKKSYMNSYMNSDMNSWFQIWIHDDQEYCEIICQNSYVRIHLWIHEFIIEWIHNYEIIYEFILCHWHRVLLGLLVINKGNLRKLQVERLSKGSISKTISRRSN